MRFIYPSLRCTQSPMLQPDDPRFALAPGFPVGYHTSPALILQRGFSRLVRNKSAGGWETPERRRVRWGVQQVDDARTDAVFLRHGEVRGQPTIAKRKTGDLIHQALRQILLGLESRDRVAAQASPLACLGDDQIMHVSPETSGIA